MTTIPSTLVGGVLNYCRNTFLLNLAAHIAYGAIVGTFVRV